MAKMCLRQLCQVTGFQVNVKGYWPADQKSSQIDPSLIQAYIDTRYEIIAFGKESQNISVLMDRPSPLAHLAIQGAFITAANPFSQPLNAAQNETRNSHLFARLNLDSISFHAAQGIALEGDWLPELGFFVVTADLDYICSLAIEHEQNAIVWVDNCLPNLILLR